MDYFHALRTFLSDLLFPAHCVGCSRVGISLCTTCVEMVPKRTAQECIVCSSPSPDGRLCPACRPHTAVDRLLIGGAPGDTLLIAAIHALKYRATTDLAAPLGQWLGRVLAPPDNHLVTAVPLHPRRMRERGYNQAELLARSLCSSLSVSYADALLERTRHTKSQVAIASRTERLKNMNGMFVCPHPSAIAGHNIVIVDDVCTTGATLHACADALKRAGAATVTALVLTRG